MIRKYLYIFLLGYLIAINLSYVFIPLKAFSLQELILFYPMEGEEQANKNFFRIFFVILPGLLLLSNIISYGIYFFSKKLINHGDKILKITLIMIIILNILTSFQIYYKIEDALNILISIPIFLFAYMFMAISIILVGRKIICI